MKSRTAATGTPPRDLVVLDISSNLLRDLLQADLELSGFHVANRCAGDADVLITDGTTHRQGQLLTVRLGTEISVESPDGTWWFPNTEIAGLVDVLRTELGRTKAAA